MQMNALLKQVERQLEEQSCVPLIDALHGAEAPSYSLLGR